MGKSKNISLNLLPFPPNSLSNCALLPEFLPEVMQKLNRGLDTTLLLKKERGTRSFKLPLDEVDKIKIVYIECVNSIEKHAITDADITAIDYAMKIIETKMAKVGIDPSAIKENLAYNKKNINREFFVTQLDNGDRVCLSKGALMIAVIKKDELDFAFIKDCIDENDLVRAYIPGDMHDAFECYISNPMFSDRLAMDFASVDHNEEKLAVYAEMRHIRPLKDQDNKKVYSNLQFAEKEETRNAEYTRALRL